MGGGVPRSDPLPRQYIRPLAQTLTAVHSRRASDGSPWHPGICSTLIALLKTVGLYWQQEKLAANAQEIWDETSELHDRLDVFHGHLAKVGKNLNTAVNGYNSAVGRDRCA